MLFTKIKAVKNFQNHQSEMATMRDLNAQSCKIAVIKRVRAENTSGGFRARKAPKMAPSRSKATAKSEEPVKQQEELDASSLSLTSDSA